MKTADGIAVFCRFSEIRNVAELIENPRNPNHHPKNQLERLGEIIRNAGWRQPVTISSRSGMVVKGHGRLQAAKVEGLTECPVEVQDYPDEAAELADMIADNRIAELAEMDEEGLAAVLQDLQTEQVLPMTGYDDSEVRDLMQSLTWDASVKSSLAETFLVPPFTTFDARNRAWQERKKAWLAIGLRSEETREVLYKGLNQLAKMTNGGTAGAWAGTSIFDPVLCEIAYAWFSRAGDRVLDPFAGGSVRGVVASRMGRAYTGIDLRAEQVEANRTQAEELCSETLPEWVCGDSRAALDGVENGAYQMMLSCPPYADLEKYSDDPNDLSNMPYADFLTAYRDIIRKAFDKLTDNAFAVWVVGEVRDKSGNYYGFLADTIKAFTDAGFRYYNEAVLLTQVASKALTARNSMNATRKLAKVHQNVLVFCKGAPRAAATRLGEIALADFDADDGC